MESTNLLSVSLGNYKEKIDSLNESLKTLKKSSEEYATVVEKIKSLQKELDDILGNSADSIDKMASSYSSISTVLSSIKDSIGNLSKSLGELDFSKFDGLSESFSSINETLTQHIEIVNQASEAQNAFNDSVSTADTSNAEASYQSLMEQLKQLRESLSEASSEAERSDIGESIANVAQQLSQLDGATSLKDFKAEIEELKASLLGLEQGSQGYNAVLQELRDKQDNLNKALTDAKYGAENADGSYNALVATMSNLRKAWKETNDEVERVELGKKILEINSKLKQLDSTIGNHQRNVGDYANQFETALNKVGGSVGKSITSIKGMGTAIKTAFTTTPIALVVGALSALIGVFKMVGDAIEGDEELQNRWNEAMAAFEPIILVAKEALMKFVEGVVSLVEWASKAGTAISDLVTKTSDWLGITKDANKHVGETIALKKEENKLDKEKRENSVKISEIQQTMSEREEKIALARRTNSKEYKRLMAEQKADQEKINTLTVETAKKELELAQQRAALSRNSKADNDALAKAQIAYNNAISQGQKAIAALTKQEQRGVSSGGGKTKEDIAIERLEKYVAKLKETSDEEEKELRNLLKIKAQLYELDAKNGEKYEETVSKHRELLQEEAQIIDKTRKTTLSQEKDAIEQIKKELKIEEDEIKKLRNASPNDEGWTKKEIEAIKILQYYRNKYIEETQKFNDAQHQIKLFNIEEDLKGNEREFQSHLSNVEHDLEKTMKDFEVKLQQADLTFKPTFGVEEIWNSVQELTEKSLEYWKAIEKEGEESAERMYGKQLDELRAKVPQFIKEYSDIYLEVEEKAFNTFGGNVADLFVRDKDKVSSNIANAVSEIKKQIYELEDKESDGFFINYDKEEKRLKELSDLTYYYQVLTLDYTDTTQKKYYNGLIDAQQEYLKTLVEGSDEYLKVQQEINDLEYESEYEHTQRILELYDLKQQKEREDSEASKKHKGDVKKAYQDLANSIGGVMGGIADIMEANIDAKIKDGEISEEEAKKEFERVKKVQLAELWINTLAGSAGAFLQDMKTYPSPYNYIIAGIDFSTAMLQGIAQSKAIQQQEYGSSGGGGSTSAVAQVEAVAVNPLLNETMDAQLMSTMDTNEALGNMTDQRVYILQSDITESNKQVQIRQSNTSF